MLIVVTSKLFSFIKLDMKLMQMKSNPKRLTSPIFSEVNKWPVKTLFVQLTAMSYSFSGRCRLCCDLVAQKHKPSPVYS